MPPALTLQTSDLHELQCHLAPWRSPMRSLTTWLDLARRLARDLLLGGTGRRQRQCPCNSEFCGVTSGVAGEAEVSRSIPWRPDS